MIQKPADVPGPLQVDLPEWAQTIRPHQAAAVESIVRRFKSGAQVVVLDAPTGSGKTLTAELVRRALESSALYLCVDRGLQDQVLRDFPYAKVIKGRRNYPTANYPDRFTSAPFLTCDDCNAQGEEPCDYCTPRGICPYLGAKRAALCAELACANTSYFLAECNGPSGFSGRFPLVIVDEADRLESVIMGSVTAVVSRRRILEWGISGLNPEAENEVAARWLLDTVLPEIARELRSLPDLDDINDVRVRRRVRALTQLEVKLEGVADGLRVGTWVLTEEQDRAADSGERRDVKSVAFKPVKVDEVAREQFWPHAPRFLLMSATILNPANMMRDLGITESWGVVRMPSTFPPERRPVLNVRSASVTAKNEDAAVPALARDFKAVLAKHKDERILVHTVSFRLMQKLRLELGEMHRPLFWYSGADTRSSIVQQYLETERAVLVAPALERGVDFPDDACRVIIVVKIPYPSLGDRQVKARLNGPGGNEWYRDATLRSLIQSTGRGMRHKEDTCVSYVLDAQFDSILARHSSVIPAWWLESVVEGTI